MKQNNHKIFNVFCIVLAWFLFAAYPVSGLADGAYPYNKILFFGDSLSDNGNLYSFDFGYLPKSPPYFEGRFSNGYVWSEAVAKYLYDSNYISSDNYAIGGETAIFHNPVNGYLPYSLTASLNSYLLRSAFGDRSMTLFVIWIGGNDYLKGSTEVDQLTTDVVANIKATIESLIYRGGVNFLIINLPDLSLTPYAKENNMVQNLHELTAMHNTKLAEAVTQIQDGYKNINIHLYDVSTLFAQLIENPDVFNKKYQLHIKNTGAACWQGGYTRKQKQASLTEEAIAQQLQEQMRMKIKSASFTDSGAEQPKLDSAAFAHQIATTPALAEAYKTSEKAAEGELPCRSPDEYVFWDHIHPTAVMHSVLAKDIIGFIDQNYPRV